jgi:hypothetical protein
MMTKTIKSALETEVWFLISNFEIWLLRFEEVNVSAAVRGRIKLA